MKALNESTNHRVLWLFFALTVFQSLYLLIWYWPGALPDGPTSGVWISLAYDFSQGIFYRPLMDETGYGGTRYMPLFFVLHGILIRLFAHPLEAGIFLTLASSLFLNAGLYFALRAFNLPRHIALPFTVAINCTISYQMTTLNVRGDFLAAAFSIWGVWFAIKYKRLPAPMTLLLAGTCFVLAFLTKFTSLFGFLAVVAYLWVSGKNLPALRFFCGTLLGGFLSVVAIHFLSDGRALESFLACATGGLENLSPVRFIFHFVHEAIRDPIFFGLFAFTLFFFIFNVRHSWKELPFLLFAATLGITLFIFSSPGTTNNHFIDLEVAMILLIAPYFHQRTKYTHAIPLLFLAISGYMVLSWFPGVPSIKKDLLRNQKPTVETVDLFYERYGQQASPVLSHFTLFSILNGKRPVVGDLFNLYILAEKFPEIKQDFEEKVKTQFFGSVVTGNWPVVFEKDVDSREDPYFLEKVDQYREQRRQESGEFYELIEQYYEIASVRRPFIFYLPKDSAETSP